MFVKISGDNSSFKKSVKDSQNDLSQFESFTEATANRMSAIGSRMVGAIGFAAIGAGALAAANKFEEAAVQIARSTGATGEKLEALEKSYVNVYKQTAASSEAVATTLALLSTRTQATGKDLEDLTLKTIKLAKTQSEDVATIVPVITQMFGAWGIATRNQSKDMDFLRVVSQQTGSHISTLSETVTAAMPQLKAFGYDWQQAAVMVANFDKTGVLAQGGLIAFKTVLKTFTKEGITDTAAAWKELVAGVKDGTVSYNEFLKIAGAKGGAALFEAIKAGRTEVDQLTGSYQHLADEGGKSITTLHTKFTILQHQVESVIVAHKDLIVTMGLLTPAATALFPIMSGLVATLIKSLGTAEVATVALGTSTFALGGTYSTVGGTIAAAGRVASVGWLPFFAAIAAAAAIAYGLSSLPATMGVTNPKVQDTGKRENRQMIIGSNGMPAPNPYYIPPSTAAEPVPGAASPAPSPEPSSANKLTTEQYQIMAAEIDAAAAHQKAMLELERSGYVQEEALQRISAKDNLARLEAVNQEELKIALDGINQKLALQRQTGEGKKDATLLAQQQAAIDAAAKTSQQIRQALEKDDERVFDENVKAHIQGLNAKMEAQDKELTELVKYHAQGLNAELEFGYKVRDHAAQLNDALANDRVKAQSEEVSAEMAHQTRMLELKRSQGDFDLKMGKITAAQRIALDQEIDTEEEDLQRKAIQREIDLLDERTGANTTYASDRQKLENQLGQLDDQRVAKSQKSDQAIAASRINIGVELQSMVHSQFNSIESAIATDIVTWKGWAASIKSIATSLAEDFLKIMLKVLFKPLEDYAAVEAGKLGKTLGGIFTSSSSAGGGVASGASAASSAASSAAKAGSSTASGAAGAASSLSSVVGIIGGISAAVGAVSSIVGNFQMAGMNKTLDLIENYTRYLKIGLVTQGDSLLNDSHMIRNTLTDFMKFNWDVLTPYLQGMSINLDAIAGSGGKSGGGNVFNFYGANLDDIKRELKLAGVLPNG